MSTTVFALLLLCCLVSGAAIAISLMQFGKLRKLDRENRQLKAEYDELLRQANSTEFEHTKFILNPHLFKNTLNSIQGYAFRTHQALEKLGSVLDYVLYDSNAQLISLKQELDFARNFIELNKIKLMPVYDIRVKENVDPEHPFFNKPIVIPLITAYFIENTFKHADLQSTDAFISIDIELRDGQFLFTVSNKLNKKPMFNPKSGIGKENMKRRLDLIYKNCYTLDYITEGDTYTSFLKLNLLEFENKMYNPR